MSFFQMGPETLAIPMEMFRENREKVCNALQGASTTSGSIILLEGGDDISLYDTDVHLLFKQVR